MIVDVICLALAQITRRLYCQAIVLVATNKITKFADQNSGLFRRRITILFLYHVPP